LPEEAKEKYDKPVRITAVPAEIQIKHLQNTSLELYL
jgi:hypothetical protein